jgi:hypothetical protein
MLRLKRELYKLQLGIILILWALLDKKIAKIDNFQ